MDLRPPVELSQNIGAGTHRESQTAADALPRAGAPSSIAGSGGADQRRCLGHPDSLGLSISAGTAVSACRESPPDHGELHQSQIAELAK